MEFEYNLTEKDYINFNIFHFGKAKVAKRSMLIQQIVGPALFIIFGYIYYSTDASASLPFTISAVVILSAIWVSYYPIYFKNFIRRRTKGEVAAGNNSVILGKHTMIFNEKEIVDATATERAATPWEYVLDFKEDKHALYLYTGTTSAYIIPKSEIKNIEEVKGYISSKLK